MNVPLGLLAASPALSVSAILATLLSPRTQCVQLPEVERREISHLRADLYVPSHGQWPGIVLVLGALREGRRYPLLEKAARTIAACGYAVLVPELGKLRRLVLGDDAVDDLVGAIHALPRLDGVQSTRVGLIGFSLGGSLALLAAGDNRIRDRISTVGSMGGYFRLTDILAAATTGATRNGDAVALAAPSTFAVAASLVARTPPPDRERLQRALDEEPDQPLEAVAAVESESMAPQTRAMLALLTNRDSGAVDKLLHKIDGAEQMMARLSPESVFGRIQVPVWVLHDERDRYVPVEQLQLMREAAASRSNFRFFRVRLLEHTEPMPPVLRPSRLVGDYVPGLLSLFRFVYGPLRAVRNAAQVS